MSTVHTCPVTVQYTYLAGPVLRDENGHTRPVTLDEIEQQFGQRLVEDVLGQPGTWHQVAAAAPSAQPTAPRLTHHVEIRGKKFLAYITLNGVRKPVRVGLFIREADAHLASEAKARLLLAGVA